MSSPSVVVIGAGVAGLACAGELARGGHVAVVLERSRGVGGRLATRRVNGQPVDHGCPFVHGRTPEFAAVVAGVASATALPDWPRRVREKRLACNPDAFASQAWRWADASGVNALARHLARGVDVRRETPVVSLETDGAQVTAIAADGACTTACTLVVAGSLAQSLRLLDPWAASAIEGEATLARLRAIPVLPVLTVIAGYGMDAPDPGFDTWNPLETTMLQSLIHDSAKRTAPAERVLVLHSRNVFARERLAEPAEAWGADLLWEAGELLGDWVGAPRWTQARRWASARIRRRSELPAPAVFAWAGGARVIVAGDAFSPLGGVEGAHASGLAAAALALEPGATPHGW